MLTVTWHSCMSKWSSWQQQPGTLRQELMQQQVGVPCCTVPVLAMDLKAKDCVEHKPARLFACVAADLQSCNDGSFSSIAL